MGFGGFGGLGVQGLGYSSGFRGLGFGVYGLGFWGFIGLGV